MPRVTYRTVPVQRSDGVVQRQRVRSDRLASEYGRVSVNARGKLAYVKKDSAVRALELVRGEGASLRRVRLTFKGKYVPGPASASETGEVTGGRRDHPLKLEGDLTVTIPEDQLEDFKEAMLEWVAEQAERFGLSDEDWTVNEVRNEPAVGALVSAELASVVIRGREFGTASSALRDQAQALLDDLDVEGVEGEGGDDDEVESLMRAVQAVDKRGRTYWYDPETGRRTLNPELVQ